jgi:hypothetical protein
VLRAPVVLRARQAVLRPSGEHRARSWKRHQDDFLHRTAHCTTATSFLVAIRGQDGGPEQRESRYRVASVEDADMMAALLDYVTCSP